MPSETISGLTGKLRGARTGAAPATGWERARGATRFSARFDVIGNFPAYQTWAALIVGAKIELTAQYLLVDEFAPHGFALPLDQIVDYSVDRDEQSFGDVIVRYRNGNGADLALFRLRAGRGRLRLPTRTNPTQLATALADVGLRATDFAQSLSGILRVAWETAHTFENDAAVWAGEVTAPLRPGMECAPASAWVTKSNVLWGSKRGSGLNRIPTGAITGIARHRLDVGRSTPIAYVHTNLINGLDLALPFIFNQVSGAQARIDRDAFIALFHPDLVHDSAPEPMQTWTTFADVVVEADPPVDAEAPAAGADADLPDDLLLTDEQIALMVTEGLEPVPEPEPTPVEAEPEEPAGPDFSAWTEAKRPDTMAGFGGSTLRRVDMFDDDETSGYEPGGTRLVEALAAWPGALGSPPEAEQATPTATEPVLILAYLARAKLTINEVNEGINRRLTGHGAVTLRVMPPSTTEQANALMELIELGGTGYYSAEQQGRVKAQLSAIGEAAIRLRSLLELCNAGHMTIGEAAAKRDRIMGSIAMLLESD